MTGQPKKKYHNLKGLMPEPVYIHYNWPSKNSLKNMNVLNQEVSSVRCSLESFKHWQNLFLSKEWHPSDNAKWLFIGQNEAIRNDSISVKWEKDKYKLMQVQTRSFFLLKVTLPDHNYFKENKSICTARAEKLTIQMMQKLPYVEKWIRGKVGGYYKGIRRNFLLSEVETFEKNGLPVTYRIHIAYGYGSRWYEMINWFNYGNTFCIYFLKQTGAESITLGYGASGWFNIGMRSAFLIAREELKRLKLSYNKKIMVRPVQKGSKWFVSFNRGTSDEITVIIDSLTGIVLEVVDKNKRKIER